MKNQRIKFTKKMIDDLPPAEPGKRAYLYDTEIRGLAVAVTDQGVKSFILYRRIKGKPERMFIGRFPDWSIEKARGKAGEFTGAIADGENPADKRRLDRAEMTLKEFFAEYLERHAKVRKTTWKEDESKFNQYLASSNDGINIASRKLSEITKADMATLHTKIGKAGHQPTANRVLALASSIFGRAIEWGIWKGENPCRGIRHYKEQSRDRFLQGDELKPFFVALNAEENETIRDCVVMLLLTGARRSNVQSMRWEDLTLADERHEWLIPMTKSGESHRLPLPPAAVEILNRRKAANEELDEPSPYVFPRQKNPTRKEDDGKPAHIVELKRAWARIRAASKLKNIRLHDLRRTLGSWQAALGASLPLIGKTLAHKNIETTAIYARLNLDPVKHSITEATNAILVAGGVKEPAKVRKARRAGAR